MTENIDLHKLKNILSKELPGENAQYKMAPKIRKELAEQMLKKGPPKESSVLILLYPKADDYYIVFTQRHTYNGVHSGQVSFPGGKHEKTDQSFFDTATREANEEMGVDENDLEYIGKLSQLFVPPSRFNIHPFVSYINYRPAFIPQQTEVKSFFEVPLSLLISNKIVHIKEIEMANGQMLETPYYDLYGHVVWGATAMILAEFLDVLKDIGLNEK